MSKSDKPQLNLYQKIHKIQCHVLGLRKDSRGHGYEYVSGDKLLDHIKPLMNELGLLLKPEVIGIENERQDYEVRSGSKSEILTTLRLKYTWVDIDTGERDENLFAANGQNGWDKGVGSALTYSERYFLLKYFHISTDEDDIDNPLSKKEDAGVVGPGRKETKSTTTPPVQKPNNNQSEERPWLNKMQGKDFTKAWLNVLEAIGSGKVTSVDQIKKHYKVSKETQAEIEEALNLKPQNA